MNEILETQVKAPAFDDATIAALVAEKQTDPNKEILVQTEEDYEGAPENPAVNTFN